MSVSLVLLQSLIFGTVCLLLVSSSFLHFFLLFFKRGISGLVRNKLNFAFERFYLFITKRHTLGTISFFLSPYLPLSFRFIASYVLNKIHT